MNSTMFIFRILWSIIVLMSCMTNDAALDGKGLLINCGLFNSTNSKSSLDGRVWQSDDDPAFAPTNLKTVSTTVAIVDAADLPYKTARVFWSEITCTFSNITAGPKFIRVYFFPNVSFYNTLPHQFSTSLVANNFILLHEFNPYINSPQNTLKCEFQVILQNGDNSLNLTFSPGTTNGNIPISYGYVNGIEIESIPEGLYVNQSKLNYTYVNDTKIDYNVNINFAAFQTAYRVDVGGENVEESEDNPGGMKRRWEADDKYLVSGQGIRMPNPWAGTNRSYITYNQETPPYVAPKIVYETARMMGYDFFDDSLKWMFEVDSGFNYVVRLHFCNLYYGNREMDVYIGGYLAQKYLNITAEAGGNGIPMYKDYVITMAGTSNGSKVDLSVALQPRYI